VAAVGAPAVVGAVGAVDVAGAATVSRSVIGLFAASSE
jgi:hypothetical protein